MMGIMQVLTILQSESQDSETLRLPGRLKDSLYMEPHESFHAALAPVSVKQEDDRDIAAAAKAMKLLNATNCPCVVNVCRGQQDELKSLVFLPLWARNA
jgi:hypothetical protein